jgi:hypothetical protein
MPTSNSEEIGKNLIAYCGLYCKDCIRYRSAFIDTAKELINLLAECKFDRYASIKSKHVTSFQEFDHFLNILRDIVKLGCDTPCREGDGCQTFDCEILRCCRDKGYEGCWQCEEINTCEKFGFLEDFHGDYPKRNCRLIGQYEIEEFIELRYPAYAWCENKHKTET